MPMTDASAATLTPCQNLQTAKEVEAVVRAGGAVPATIAILGGVPHVGLTAEQLERLARGGKSVRKCSRRDLPAVCAARADGATTVSATMLLAAAAGIGVFVTGGIGGVHRGGQDRWGGGHCAPGWVHSMVHVAAEGEVAVQLRMEPHGVTSRPLCRS